MNYIPDKDLWLNKQGILNRFEGLTKSTLNV